MDVDVDADEDGDEHVDEEVVAEDVVVFMDMVCCLMSYFVFLCGCSLYSSSLRAVQEEKQKALKQQQQRKQEREEKKFQRKIQERLKQQQHTSSRAHVLQSCSTPTHVYVHINQQNVSK